MSSHPCFLDDLGVALSFYVPVQKPSSWEKDEYQEEIDKLLVRQQAIADFINQKISAADYLDILRETDLNLDQYTADISEGYT